MGGGGIFNLCSHIVHIVPIVCQGDRVGMLEEVINRTPGLWEMTPAVTPLTLTLWSAQLVYGCVGGGACPGRGEPLHYKPITERGSDG